MLPGGHGTRQLMLLVRLMLMLLLMALLLLLEPGGRGSAVGNSELEELWLEGP